MVNKAILNNSANKNGVTPNWITGLSHPIKFPSHKTPKMYIIDTETISLIKINIIFVLKFKYPARKVANKKPIR